MNCLSFPMAAAMVNCTKLDVLGDVIVACISMGANMGAEM